MAVLCLAAALPAVADEQASGRFFYSGDGVLRLHGAHGGEAVRVRFRDGAGDYSAEALARIDRVFRARGGGEGIRVSLRLVELIDYLQDREKPKSLLLVSGYRSEGYNEAIIARGGQAAQASLHTEGLAADLRFAGVDHRALWNRLRALECCGAGYYRKSGFVHVDVGRPRFWEETTSRVGENLSAGNARIFARTEFDRYRDVADAQLVLHSVTLYPLRISSRAEVVPDDAAARGASSGRPRSLRLTATGKEPSAADGCIEFPRAEADPAKRTLHVAPEPAAQAPDGRAGDGARDSSAPVRARIVLSTCEPRLEATPATIESNPIEVTGAAGG